MLTAPNGNQFDVKTSIKSFGIYSFFGGSGLGGKKLIHCGKKNLEKVFIVFFCIDR
jgi:hypothetical protein